MRVQDKVRAHRPGIILNSISPVVKKISSVRAIFFRFAEAQVRRP